MLPVQRHAHGGRPDYADSAGNRDDRTAPELGGERDRQDQQRAAMAASHVPRAEVRTNSGKNGHGQQRRSRSPGPAPGAEPQYQTAGRTMAR